MLTTGGVHRRGVLAAASRMAANSAVRSAVGSLARNAVRRAGAYVGNRFRRMLGTRRPRPSTMNTRRVRTVAPLPMRRGLRRVRRSGGVPTGKRPTVGVIDHQTKKMKFSVYQHYVVPVVAVGTAPQDLAVNMSASELLFVNRPTGTIADPSTYRARQPAFYNAATKWMTFGVTGMKMEITDETGNLNITGGDLSSWLLYEHRGGAWSTVWNETDGDSHKPMLQYVDNVHPPAAIAPRWRFQKEAKWEDKSYRRAAFGVMNPNRIKFQHRGKVPFFSRYSGLRAPASVGEGANGVHIVADRRDWLPTLHLHQPDQFMQYQANQVRFAQVSVDVPDRVLRLRVKKTWFVEFADKREKRNIAKTALTFRPHEDECWLAEQLPNESQCAGCTGLDNTCVVAGAPRAGPAPDPASCTGICGESCEDMLCPPGEIPATVNAAGCVDSCAVGVVVPGGGPCFTASAAALCLDTCGTGAPFERVCALVDPTGPVCNVGFHLEQAPGGTPVCNAVAAICQAD